MKIIKKTLLLLLLLLNMPAMIDAQNLLFQDYLNVVGKNNLEYLAEKCNVNIADAEVMAQKVFPDPDLSFEAAQEVYSVGLEYSLELGKRSARVRLAKSQAELERMALEYFFQELRADAANAFLDALFQRDLLAVKKSSYEYMRQMSRSDSLRFVSGEITETDVLQSKVEASMLLNEAYKQEAAYLSAVAELNRYMGKGIDESVAPQGALTNLDRNLLLPELIATGLDKRMDLVAAHKNTEVAENQLRLTKAERRPNIGLSAGYEREWGGVTPNFEQVRAGISIPLTFSNINKGAIRSAKHAVEQTKIKQQGVELQIQTEIAQAFFNYEASKKQVKQYHLGALDDSKKVLEGMMYKYKRGETNLMEVLIAQRSYNDVQEQYLETMTECAKALVELEKSCGIWDVDF